MTAELISREELLPLLGPVRKQGADLLAFCPVHRDGEKHGRRAGQSLVLHASGVLKCYAGCDTMDVINALRARSQSTPKEQPRRQSEPVRVYEYRNEDGDLLAVKGRFETPSVEGKPEKRFLWRLPEGTWQEGIKSRFPGGVSEMPLYGAEMVAKAPLEQRVWVAEGEKATEAIRARQELAVCGPWGASQSEFGTAFEVLRGRDVLLWPDNDPAGRDYMARVKRRLLDMGIARTVATVSAPVPPKGDAVEYFGSGGTIDGLLGGILLRPTVDVLSQTHFLVRVPTDTGIPALFDFDDVSRKGTRSIEAALTVSYGQAEPFVEGVNTLSQSGRESVVRHLGGQFGKDVNWTAALNTAYSRLKSTYEEITASIAEYLRGHTDPSKVDFLLEPYVIRGGGTILFGPPERGKSWTGMLMAVSVDAGCEAVWSVTRPAPTLYVNLERDGSSMARRLARVNLALGFPVDRPLLFINARGKTLADVSDAVKAAIRERGIELIVVDSMSRSGAGDLKADETGNRIMDMLNGFGVAWLAIAHTPRGDETHVFGTVMQDAAADVMVAMSSETGFDGTLGVGLQVIKANDFRKPPAETLAYEMDPDYGLTIVRKAQAHEFVEVEAQEKKGLTQLIIEYLLDHGAASGDDIAKAIGKDPSNVNKKLKARPFVFVRREGRSVLYGVEAQDGSLDGNHGSNHLSRMVDGGGNRPPIGNHQPSSPSSDSTEDLAECSRCRRLMLPAAYTPSGDPLCVTCFDEGGIG